MWFNWAQILKNRDNANTKAKAMQIEIMGNFEFKAKYIP